MLYNSALLLAGLLAADVISGGRGSVSSTITVTPSPVPAWGRENSDGRSIFQRLHDSSTGKGGVTGQPCVVLPCCVPPLSQLGIDATKEASGVSNTRGESLSSLTKSGALSALLESG